VGASKGVSTHMVVSLLIGAVKIGYIEYHVFKFAPIDILVLHPMNYLHGFFEIFFPKPFLYKKIRTIGGGGGAKRLCIVTIIHRRERYHWASNR